MTTGDEPSGCSREQHESDSVVGPAERPCYGSPPSLSVVKLETGNCADIPAMLRELADGVERGDYVDAHNLAWVIDCGDCRVELGMMGKAGEPAAVAHFLFALAMQKLQNAGLGE